MLNPKKAGFSLVELMISMTITLIVLTALIVSFRSQQRNYFQQTDLAGSQARARAALNMVARDVRMAGYTGIPLGADILAENTASPEYPVMPTYSTGSTLEIRGNFARNHTQLSQFASTGATELIVDNLKPFTGTGINQPGFVIVAAGSILEVHEFVSAATDGTQNKVTIRDGIDSPVGIQPSTTTSPVWVAPFYRWIYEVKDHPTFRDNHNRPLPTLYLENWDSDSLIAEVEIATGVSDFQVSFGIIDQNGQAKSGLITLCRPCDIRTVDLRLQTVSDKLREANQPIRRWFSTSVKIRNLGFSPHLTGCCMAGCSPC